MCVLRREPRQLGKKVLPIREVAVDGRPRHARFLGDVVHVRPLASRGKRARGGFQNRRRDPPLERVPAVKLGRLRPLLHVAT